MRMQPSELREQRRRLEAELLREEDKRWVHHVADLDRGERVLTVVSERPTLRRARLDRIADLDSTIMRSGIEFQLFERRLTPRAPYQATPLSYLNAMGRSWSLWGSEDRLEWYEFAPDRRYGGIEF